MKNYIRDYGKGKIYKIIADTKEEYKPYVGSTIQGLAERMAGYAKRKSPRISRLKWG